MTLSVRLAATGDIVLTRSLASCPPDPAVDALRDVLAEHDIVLSSVELPFSEQGHPSDRILNFRGAPELVDDLRAFSVNLATVANNHSSDYGWVALEDSIAGMRAAGTAVIGAGADLAEAERPHVVEIRGLRVGFIAWSCLMPLGAAAGPHKPGIAPIHIDTWWEVNGEFQLEEPGVPPRIRTAPRPADRERVLVAVERLRSQVDVAIVTLHWGYGFGTDQAEYQRRLGRDLVDAGASAVLGHHVHAPQGVELYRGAPIVYSPGNFIAQQPRVGATPEILAIYDAFSPDAFVSMLTLSAGGHVGLELLPIRTNPHGLPSLATGPVRDRIVDELRVESRRRFDTELESVDGRLHVREKALAR